MIGIGESKEEAFRNYKEILESDGNKIDLEKSEDFIKVEGTVSRINQDIKGGNATYYITVEGNNLIFTGNSKISNELPLTMVGDKVNIMYIKSKDNVVSMSEFDNLNLGNKQEPKQEEKEKKSEENAENTNNNESN